jgi:DNA-binding transcriptional MerR regulator
VTIAADSAAKSSQAFRTIGEAAAIIGVPQHVLRFWETRFPQLQPLKRGGNRRYYRPGDMDLLQRIRTMLHDDGLTIRGAQQLLAAPAPAAAPKARTEPSEMATIAAAASGGMTMLERLERLRGIRDRLRGALAA